jgi:hypothetical protein
MKRKHLAYLIEKMWGSYRDNLGTLGARKDKRK